MAVRDPAPPDSDVESSTTDEERHAQRCLFRHMLFFMLGIFVFIVVGFFVMSTKAGALAVTITAGVCWMLSGVYAIEGRRHMFAGMRWGSFGQVTMRPSKSSRTGAIVAGVILILLGMIGFGNVAVWIWMS